MSFARKKIEKKEIMMKDYFLRRVSHVVVAAFLAMVSFAGVSVASAAEPKLDDKWHFTLIPYVWLPSVDGEMNVDHSGGIGSSNIDIGSSSYMDNLQFAAMFSLELEKGRKGRESISVSY